MITDHGVGVARESVSQQASVLALALESQKESAWPWRKALQSVQG
jgi:hypothetical protein